MTKHLAPEDRCVLCVTREAAYVIDATWLPTGRRAVRKYCGDGHCFGRCPVEGKFWKIHHRAEL